MVTRARSVRDLEARKRLHFSFSLFGCYCPSCHIIHYSRRSSSLSTFVHNFIVRYVEIAFFYFNNMATCLRVQASKVLHNNGQLEMAVIMTQEEQLHLYSFAEPFLAHWPVEPTYDANRNYSCLGGWRDMRKRASK